MGNANVFSRCVYCFAPKTTSGHCESCGYDHGLCDQPGYWLPPGTVLKGRFIVGRNLSSNHCQITYLGWDLINEKTVDVVEYFPEGFVTRDITYSDQVVTIPGNEERVEAGRQTFFEKAKLFFNCVSRVEENLLMDFFLRNNTCYYILKRQQKG